MFDREIALALAFRWTPQEVGDLDPDFIDEVLAVLDARNEVQREINKK